MTIWERITQKYQPLQQAVETVDRVQQQGCEVVFTNGCFDLLHYGHLVYLAQARELGGFLVVGLNSQQSVSRLKGKHRPIKDEQTRAHALAALQFVDLVVRFDEDTPLALIKRLRPDILVKGGDYELDQIVGAADVQAWGGQVLTLPFIEGYSTTALEEKIRSW